MLYIIYWEVIERSQPQKNMQYHCHSWDYYIFSSHYDTDYKWKVTVIHYIGGNQEGGGGREDFKTLQSVVTSAWAFFL